MGMLFKLIEQSFFVAAGYTLAIIITGVLINMYLCLVNVFNKIVLYIKRFFSMAKNYIKKRIMALSLNNEFQTAQISTYISNKKKRVINNFKKNRKVRADQNKKAAT